MDPKTVLLVDDNVADLEMTQLAFVQSGIEARFVTAGDGIQALELLAKGLRPDLIVLDMYLPLVNGADTLARIKGDPAYSGIPTVIFTSSDQQCHRNDCEDLRANDYLIKPVSWDEFVQTIATLSRFLSPSEIVDIPSN